MSMDPTVLTRAFTTCVRPIEDTARLQGRGLEATYAVHLRLVGKPVVDFLLVIIELYLLGVTAEALRANIDWKSPLLEGVGHFGPKFQVEEDETKRTKRTESFGRRLKASMPNSPRTY